MSSVIVTGGTTRLGKEISERLRKGGWRVITTSHRADAGADIVADLSDEMGAARLYSAAMKLLDGGVPDALVNNAAVFSGDDDSVRMINFESPKKLIMLMGGREDGVGAVVNILDARDRDGVYGETKRSLADFSLKAASMFAGVLRVNSVSPGPVLPPVGFHEQAGDTPFGRPTPEDVAEAVAYFLGAKTVSGCRINVDGGQSL